jgi:hypothetical protein
VNLELLDEAVAARQARWVAADISWEVVRTGADEQEAASLRAESSSRVAELLLSVSGYADLTYAQLEPRITDPEVDHYEVTTPLDLNGCLDDFERHMGINT